MRERVHSYITSTDCPTVSTQNNVSVIDLQRMYASTYNILSHLMADATNDAHIEVTYIHAKRFLNDVECVDKQLRTSFDKPVWAQKYNLLCLLNCKEDMYRYGPARQWW